MTPTCKRKPRSSNIFERFREIQVQWTLENVYCPSCSCCCSYCCCRRCCCWKLEHQVQSAGCQGYFHIQLDAWGQDWTTPKRPAKTETFMKEAFTWTAGRSGNSYSRALPPGCFCLADMILADCVFSCSNRIASGVATCVVDESIGSWL